MFMQRVKTPMRNPPLFLKDKPGRFATSIDKYVDSEKASHGNQLKHCSVIKGT